tara:strand:- start:70 stop:531 length:462 start_codon:yes stop_codon:yes gene_type:complete
MKILKLVFLFIFISNCTLNKVVKHHGVHNLKKKSDKLELFNTNSNDVISRLGIPSTKSTFDNDVWIYLERKVTSSELKTMGKKKLLLNNVLILDFNNKGMLVEKKFLTMSDMNKLTMVENETLVLNKKTTFVRMFLSSLRQKINDPLGTKTAK